MQVDISAMINKNKLTIFLNVVKYILYGTIIHTDFPNLADSKLL